MSALTPETKVTLGVVGSVLLSVAGATYWITVVVEGFRRDIAEIRELKYSLPAAAEQALRMAIENPGLGVPDPRDPSRIIRVVPGSAYTPGGMAGSAGKL